jgi:PIN domain nuclease of toxin-antitoxin system
MRDEAALSLSARKACTDPNSDLYLSAVSAWEITAKNVMGRLPLPASPVAFLRECCEHYSIMSLPLTQEAVWQMPNLANIHRDPFDRMLVCQALAHGLVILSPDPHIRRYRAPVLW